MIAHVDNASTAFIGNVGASVTPIVVSYGTCLARVKFRYVPLDMDVFPIDNSKTKKEGVGYTYKGFDGYAPKRLVDGEVSSRPGAGALRAQRCLSTGRTAGAVRPDSAASPSGQLAKRA